MTQRFYLKLWPEATFGSRVTTPKQNKHRANGKLQILHHERRPDTFDQMLKSCWRVFYANGIVHKAVPTGQTVNQQFHLNALKRFATVYGKNDQKCGAAVIGWYDLEFAAVFGKNNMTVIHHQPYSPDLAACDFFLFPRRKGQMKRKRFADVREVTKKRWRSWTSALKSSRNVFSWVLWRRPEL